MSVSPTILTKLQNSFDAQSMMRTFGAELSEVSEGRCVICAPILPGCKQQHDFGHAALAFGIGDSAAGYAALSMMPQEAEVLTTEMKINLLAPAQGDHLMAEGHVIKPGRRLVIVQADVFALLGGTKTHIATMLGSMMPVLPK